MALDHESRRVRARQVGMLLQAYRRGYATGKSRRGLSQEGLLHLMGRVDPGYLDRYDRSTVSRWESGATYPTVERLRVFGMALDLSDAEVDGLISLAGLDPVDAWDDPDDVRESNHTGESSTEHTAEPTDHVAAGNADVGAVSSSYARYTMNYALSRFAMPSLWVGGAGYALWVAGWTSTLALGTYTIVAMCLVSGHSLLRLRREGSLQELFFATVFFLLSTVLLHAPFTNLDPYGFYAIGVFAGTSVPITLALIAHLLLTTVAGLLFDFLWRWQCSSHGHRGPFRRAAWTILPPVVLVYAFQLAFSDLGTWIAGLAVFTVVAGVMVTLLVLRDGNVSIGEWDRRFLLTMAVTVTIVLSALGVTAVMFTYAEPSLISVSERSLIFSWGIDYDSLGYPEAELHERFRVGVVWVSLVSIIFMVLVLGGNLVLTIHRMNGGNAAGATAAAVATADAATLRRRRSSIRRHLDARYWVRRTADRRLPGFGRSRTDPLS